MDSFRIFFMLILNILLIFTWIVVEIEADKPCAARIITNAQSVICVCNSTYCDEVTRDTPTPNGYIAYTTSKAGSRFRKTSGQLQNYSETSSCCTTTLELDPDTKYQTIEGFGGAVTDAAGINWKNLSEELQQYLIDSYFSDTGIQYSFIRVPIGGTDFSTHAYAYNELPENDTELTNYTLTYEDYQYKIPMIKASMAASSTSINIVATTWSPPVWMKTNEKYSGYSRLKPEYFQTYADYYYKFIDKYAAEGIPIWGITTTNEPIDGVVPIAKFNSLGWSAKHMGEWIVNNLGPTIRNSTYKDIKIITVDDQRFTIPVWFNLMVKEHPKVLDYIDGVGVHYYGDFITPASVLLLVTKTHPDKFIIGTEACEGSFPWESKKVDIGSWDRAVHYINDIITDLNYNMIGWIEWNLCLNLEGGPNWAGNNVDSPVIVVPENGEFYKQPMFYVLGQFSKFVPRGSKRIAVKENKPLFSKSVENVAVLTPNNTIVVVLYNSESSARKVGVKLSDKQVVLELEANSITSVEFPYGK